MVCTGILGGPGICGAPQAWRLHRVWDTGRGGGAVNFLRHGLTPKMKPLSPKRTALVSAIDIGTSKIACLIARLRPRPAQDVLPRRSHGIEIIGIGHMRAGGIKGGNVVDLAQAETAIRHAVAAAERMGHVQLESVVVALAAGRLNERTLLRDRSCRRPDRRRQRYRARARQPAAAIRCAMASAVVHSLPIGYALDDARGIRDPRGMLGQAPRRRHACGDGRRCRRAQPDALRRALPSLCRGDGRDALCRRACVAHRR